MASGHVNRTQRPNTWLHRPTLRREDSPCQLGAVHTWARSCRAIAPVGRPLSESAGSTGRRNTGGQLPINNDEGLPNARPIAFSVSLHNQAIPQRNFLCRPGTTTKSLTYRPIIDLFHLRDSVASTG